MNGEQAFCFACDGEWLPGILHPGAPDAARGVLIVVGGPQYRAGSHRQFVLLARALAARGIPVMRFDATGMGDASGALRDFTGIDADIRSAIDTFSARQPRLQEVVIWGLCDAASAALFYAWQDRRVSGLVLLNPWVRTDAGEARAYLRYYYLRRLLSPVFWRELLRGRLNLAASISGMAGHMVRARSGQGHPDGHGTDTELAALELPQRMAECLRRFDGSVLIVLSGNDLTAAEFRDTVSGSARWQALVARESVQWIQMEKADHTFSRRQWRDDLAARTGDWVAVH